MVSKTRLERRIEPQTGTAFELRRGQVLRVSDPFGEQVSDLTAFALEDTREWLSSGRSIDYASSIALTTGHTLFSNRSNPMLTVGEDRVGKHDFLYAPCSPEMFRRLHGVEGEHPSCFQNLAMNLREFGIEPDQIPVTFNLFMNVNVLPTGELRIDPPPSKAGDYTEFRAEMDLVVGVTACSAEQTNNGSFGPIDILVFDA